MKKIKYFAYVWAIALLSTVFVACSSSETEVADNPNYDPETGEVLTNFVMNVSATNTPATRMTSGNTQATANDDFRGITNGVLLTYKMGTPVVDGKWIYNSTTPADRHYSLGNVYSASDATTDGTKSRRVMELRLPTETNTLLFYGRAPKSENEDNVKGLISWNDGVDDNKAISNYNFGLTSRISKSVDGYERDFEQYGKLMAAALNYICNAAITDATIIYNGGNFTVPSLKWTQFVTISADGKITPATKATDGTEMCPLGEILGEALATFATVAPNEYRAGSGSSIERTIGDLYVVVDNVAKSPANSQYEAVTAHLASVIKDRIGDVFDNTGAAPSITWKNISTVKEKTGYSGDIDKIVKSSINGDEALTQFPDIAFGIPKGAAQLTVTTAKSTENANGSVETPGTITWNYNTTNPSLGTNMSSVLPNNFYFPAELCYFGNSPINVTTDTHVADDYPQGISNWENADQWKAGASNRNNTVDWSMGSHVVSTTRSVAMKYNINYGTALLKSTVGYSTEAQTKGYLEDNNHAIQKNKNTSLADTEEPNAHINITGDAFKLNGILIGGQAEKVGWNYLPMSGQTFSHVIYDKALPDGGDAIPNTGESVANYTLVWDNYTTVTPQNKVYVALEFINNSGKDFWGKANIIRNQGVFYIVGVLDPAADGLASITWPDASKQALPPYGDAPNGNPMNVRRVFIQDFMTTAKFKLGPQSLQSAYVTVPDLRSTQISLGLSVDLQWQTGLTFDEVILGN